MRRVIEPWRAAVRVAPALALLALVVACGAEDERARPAALGRIVGTCRLVGHPSPAPLREWPGMGTEAGQDDESVRTTEGSALAGCVVTLDGPPPPSGMRDGRDASVVRLVALPGRFAPHLVVARAPVDLVLESRLAGDLYVRMEEARGGRTTVFDVSLAPGAVLEDVEGFHVMRPGAYLVTDDMRRQFTAWLHVVDGPHADTTSTEPRGEIPPGGYRLEGVAPGTHVVRCWHEPMDRRERVGPEGRFTGYALGAPVEVTKTVVVPPGGEARADFDVREDGAAPRTDGR